MSSVQARSRFARSHITCWESSIRGRLLSSASSESDESPGEPLDEFEMRGGRLSRELSESESSLRSITAWDPEFGLPASC